MTLTHDTTRNDRGEVVHGVAAGAGLPSSLTDELRDRLTAQVSTHARRRR